MDLVLSSADPFVLDSIYAQLAPTWERDYWFRQYVSIIFIWWLGGTISYFLFSTVSYILLFDKSLRKDPKFLKNQELQEMTVSVISIPIMAVPSAFIFLAEVKGYSKLYDDIDGPSGWAYIAFAVLIYMIFTDTLIYWIHRWLHHPILYAPIHKLHHKWIVSTPYASYAFHPVDGFMQSIPYHIFVFVIPINKIVYMSLFLFVCCWTISIHDQIGFVTNSIGNIINGADHHTIHHRQFNYNFGQYFTIWDRLCNTHKEPEVEHKQTKRSE